MTIAIHSRTLLITMLLWAACMGMPVAYGQVSLNLKASSTVISPDENITVTYSLLNASADSFLPPKFTDWMVVKGPVARTTILEENGIRTTLKEFQFILKPLRTGSCKVPAGLVVWQGKSYNSNTLVVDVLDNLEDAALARRENRPAGSNEFTYDAYVLEPQEDIEAKTRKNAFLKIRLSAERVYEGQPLVAEYLLYSRVSLQAQVARRPGFTGFSSIDILENAVGDYDLESIGGKVYKVFPIRRVQLYPLQAGTLPLEAFTVDATVSYRKLPASGQMKDFDLFSPANITEHQITLESNAPSVTVMPLPAANKPYSFSGLVGRFRFSASLNKKKLRLGETGELTVKAHGEGQWSLMPEPQIAWPPGIRAFQPSITEQLDSQMIPIKGERQWVYRFIADSAGQFYIPGIHWSSFDPVAARYINDTTPAISFEVEAVPYTTSAQDETFADNMHATDVFSRYVPYAFVSAAAMLLLALFVRRRKQVLLQRRQEEQWNETLAWPYGNEENELLKKQFDRTPYETVQEETALADNAADDPAAWKQWVQHMLASERIKQMPEAGQHELRQFLEKCNEWLYSPLASDAEKEKLGMAYRDIRSRWK